MLAKRSISSPVRSSSGLLLDRAYVDVEGQYRIEEALFRVLGDAMIHRDALRRIGGVRQLGLAHSNQLLPLTGRLIQRLQDGADFELLGAALEQRLERAQGVFVLGRRADHLAVGRDGLVQVTQANLVDLTQAELELQNLVRALSDLGLAHEHLGQILPTLHLREQAVKARTALWFSDRPRARADSG